MQTVQWYDYEIGEIASDAGAQLGRAEWCRRAISMAGPVPSGWAGKLYTKGYGLTYAVAILRRAYIRYCLG